MIINFSRIQAKGQKVGEIQGKLYWILKLNCHDIQAAMYSTVISNQDLNV